MSFLNLCTRVWLPLEASVRADSFPVCGTCSEENRRGSSDALIKTSLTDGGPFSRQLRSFWWPHRVFWSLSASQYTNRAVGSRLEYPPDPQQYTVNKVVPPRPEPEPVKEKAKDDWEHLIKCAFLEFVYEFRRDNHVHHHWFDLILDGAEDVKEPDFSRTVEGLMYAAGAEQETRDVLRSRSESEAVLGEELTKGLIKIIDGRMDAFGKKSISSSSCVQCSNRKLPNSAISGFAPTTCSVNTVEENGVRSYHLWLQINYVASLGPKKGKWVLL
ncbi:hypothetical protein T439DRAFT_369787 [Meredithblackwellia eburnea MCA 4105]